MPTIRTEILEEVEDCIRRVQAFQEAQGRRIHRQIKRSRKGREGLAELTGSGLLIPEDFQALYYNYNGIKTAMMPLWEQTVFLEFEWWQIDSLIAGNKIQRIEQKNAPTGRLLAFAGLVGLQMQLDPGAEEGGATPLLMTLGSLSRNQYIGFDSTLAMLRSVCAAQDAGVLHYRTEDAGDRRRGEIQYDPKELWDVIRPFNPRADYWPALIAGTLDWDEIELELPTGGILDLDPEVSRLIAGDPEDYYSKAMMEKMRTASLPHIRGGSDAAAEQGAPPAMPPAIAGSRGRSENAATTATLFDGEIFADYHQFYLTDADGGGDIPTDWVEDAMQDRIFCEEGVLLVTTARDMTVPVRVELHEAQPVIDLDTADHAVLGNLRTDGQLVIAGCTESFDTAARASVPPGNLRALVIFTGLGKLSDNGVDGEDRYLIHLWPSEETGITILRAWDGD